MPVRDRRHWIPERPGAIWVAVIPLPAVKRLLALFMLVIAGMALFAPAGSLGEPATELVFAMSAADAAAHARKSDFPLAFAISYSFALAASLCGAISVCLTRADMAPLARLTAGRSVFSRSIVVILLVLMVSLPFMAEMRPLESQMSGRFFRAMEHSRILLCIFCEGLFLSFAATSAWVLYEITNGFNAIFRARRDAPEQ